MELGQNLSDPRRGRRIGQGQLGMDLPASQISSPALQQNPQDLPLDLRTLVAGEPGLEPQPFERPVGGPEEQEGRSELERDPDARIRDLG